MMSSSVHTNFELRLAPSSRVISVCDMANLHFFFNIYDVNK
nr:MAG TPA: hypothetical protein [Caudoviricetes sp.]